MSCDACHLEGHADGVLFEKTVPLRIYRNPTVRGTVETPPYFVPASTFTITETVRKVGDRNRYQNPPQTVDEVKSPDAPSSQRAHDPTQPIRTSRRRAAREPDAHRRQASVTPRKGLALFDAKCASCHPAPYFTQDQSAATRNHYIEVGTPHLLELRPEQQNPRFERGFQAPALIGAWDVWPMPQHLVALVIRSWASKLEVSDRFCATRSSQNAKQRATAWTTRRVPRPSRSTTDVLAYSADAVRCRRRATCFVDRS